jgi:hypothetical protein
MKEALTGMVKRLLDHWVQTFGLNTAQRDTRITYLVI